MSVRIYVEGGGDDSTTKSLCREGFAKFFARALPPRVRPKVIACGTRGSTFDDFLTALRAHPDAFVILLVDSEGPVRSGDTAWSHLKRRDGWGRPGAAAEEQAHLMVQAMEAWFLADRDVLAHYFGQGFVAKALPASPDIEQIDKDDLVKGLAAATRHTKTKGVYHKTRHAFELLALINPDAVRRASPHAERLCAVVAQQASS